MSAIQRFYLLRPEISESFRSVYECEIAYEYDFGISNQLCSLSRRFSLLLISKGESFKNKISVLCDDLEYALSV